MREVGSEMSSPSCNAGCHGLHSCLGLSVLGCELLGQELFAYGSLYSAKSIANTSRFVAEVASCRGAQWQLLSTGQGHQQQRAQRHQMTLWMLDPNIFIIPVFNEGMYWHADLWIKCFFHRKLFSSNMTVLLLQSIPYHCEINSLSITEHTPPRASHGYAM